MGKKQMAPARYPVLAWEAHPRREHVAHHKLQPSTTHPPGLGTGHNRLDPTVRPSDDLYRHVNGHWLAHTTIPPDKAMWGSFMALRETTLNNLRQIIEEVSAHPQDATQRQLADLFASFMDEGQVAQRAPQAMQELIATVASVDSPAALAAFTARMSRMGLTTTFQPTVHQDNRNASQYILDLVQDGLGLPDREYYLSQDRRFVVLRSRYQAYMAHMLELSGVAPGAEQARSSAQAIMALEHDLAQIQWTKTANRDPIKTYNKLEKAQLQRLTPGWDWVAYWQELRLPAPLHSVVVSQPSYIAGLARIAQRTPWSTWRLYLTWHIIDSLAPYLSEPFVKAHFDFHGTALQGIPLNEPRWKRGIALLDQALGESLGKLYVARYFPPQHKERMAQLVANLLAAYRESITQNDWLGPATKTQALVKLAALRTKIGYPGTWRDYSALHIVRDDLLGNVLRAAAFAQHRELAKLGQPVDRGEWHMTPQTVNAYYNPEMNEIVFPAAILQPPFFNMAADDAVNYGGIGAVIGHEISHGFDDQGSQYDGQGNLRNWWTPEDRARFAQRTKKLVAQYSQYQPVPGYHVNGELTLGENIADVSGLAIAYRAYQLALHGTTPPVIDGMSGPQRFFAGWAQIWRAKVRDDEAIRRTRIDPHAPPQFRCNGAVVHNAGFYEAFSPQPGDGLYLPPQERIELW